MTISVVMPVYNGAERLHATMEGILNQTFGGFELIVVDDGSTDETPRLLAAWAAGDSRVRVIRQENAGITQALISGCANARGELIARHDCGDRSHPHRLAEEKSLFDDPAVVLAGCATAFFAPGGEKLYTVTAEGVNVREGLLDAPVERIRGLPHHGSAMFRRSAYLEAGGYRKEFYFAQDLDLWIRLAQRGQVAITAQVLYEAALETNAISSRHRPEQVESARIAIAIRDGGAMAPLLARAAAIRPHSKRRGGRRSEAGALYFIASCLRRNGDRRYRHYARAATRKDPLHVRAWLMLLRPL